MQAACRAVRPLRLQCAARLWTSCSAGQHFDRWSGAGGGASRISVAARTAQHAPAEHRRVAGMVVDPTVHSRFSEFSCSGPDPDNRNGLHHRALYLSVLPEFGCSSTCRSRPTVSRTPSSGGRARSSCSMDRTSSYPAARNEAMKRPHHAASCPRPSVT